MLIQSNNSSEKFVYSTSYSSSEDGFSLLETIIVLAVIGILAVIGVPSFLSWLNTRKVDAAHWEIYQALQLTQHRAMRERCTWQFSIRENGDHLEWASHPKTTLPAEVVNWNALDPVIQFDDNDTTFLKKAGVHYSRFDYQGNVDNRLGRVTLQDRQGSPAKRCVIVSTLIGAMRRGHEHDEPKDDRYCY